VIAGNLGFGISINGAEGVEVTGNYIGTDPSRVEEECNGGAGIYIAGDDFGDSTDVMIGAGGWANWDGSVELLAHSSQNYILTCDFPSIVVQDGDAPGDGDDPAGWGGGTAVRNEIALNSFKTGGAPSIDLLGWDEVSGTVLGQGPDWNFFADSGNAMGECPPASKLPPWGNNMKLAPVFEAWIASSSEPLAGSVSIQATVCSADRVDFFVQHLGSDWIEPLVAQGDTITFEEFTGPEGNELRIDSLTEVDVAEGDTLFAMSYSTADGSSELSVGVQLLPCDLSIDDDADGRAPGCGGDCDDANFWVNPNRVEVCGDGIDNDCDSATGDVDDVDDCASDHDGDGFATHEQGGDDCNDSPEDWNGDGTPDGYHTNPGADEECDGEDNNCSGAEDEGLDVGVDEDGDGWGCGEDCNDNSGSVFPGQIEICDDGLDSNCDDDPDGDCRDAGEEGWQRPPGCVVSCELGDQGDSAGAGGLALAILIAALRRRRREPGLLRMP